MPLTDKEVHLPYDEMLTLAKAQGDLVGPSSHTTRWSPDTCDCVIDQISNGVTVRIVDNKGNVRECFVYDPVAEVRCEHVENACVFHSTVTPQAHFEAVLSENQLKNRFQGELLKRLSESEQRTFEYRWSFNQDRILQVDLTTAQVADKTALADVAKDAAFAGKVEVVTGG